MCLGSLLHVNNNSQCACKLSMNSLALQDFVAYCIDNNSFNTAYDTKSVAEKGTFSQLKERFDKKNVKKDVKKDVHACREFIRFITQGLAVLAVMKVLGMSDKDKSQLVHVTIVITVQRKHF